MRISITNYIQSNLATFVFHLSFVANFKLVSSPMLILLQFMVIDACHSNGIPLEKSPLPLFNLSEKKKKIQESHSYKVFRKNDLDGC